jgi:N-acetylglucosamine-6-phosphate deacetylase
MTARVLRGIVARADGTLARAAVSFADHIESVTPDATTGGDFILPGFIDLQVNGSHGIDVMTAGPSEFAAMARHLMLEGTTAFLATAITAPLDRIERAHTAIAGAMEAGVESILGMHLEGPFISSRRLGAHPKLNLALEGDAFERVIRMDRLRLLTLAPELPGALDATRRLVARGVAVSIGHTDATLEQARAGVEAGARMFTHLYNAMRPLNHRDPGVIAAALESSAATPAIIPDGVHVHPAMLRIAIRARGAAGIVLTTDKVSLGGRDAGASFSIGSARASVSGGAARLADGTLAGAVISMLDGVRLVVDQCGVSVGEAAMMAASNPARIIGLNDRGRIEAGARADIVVLDSSLTLKAIYMGGREAN